MRLAACLALAVALLAGPAAASEQPKTVRVTYVTAPFNVPSIVMKAKGILEEAFAPLGIAVESPEITSGAQQTQAIAAGEIDIASVLGGTSAILARANGVDLKVVAAYARAPKAFLLVTRGDGPATLADLKGRKIAGPKGTVLHQLLVAALVSEGLTVADVDYINMDLPTARAALLAGEVDVATLAGNNASAVLAAGGKVLTSGEGLIRPTTVVAARGAFLAEHPDLVATYLAATRQTLAVIAADPDEAIALAAAEQKLSIDDAKAQFPLYDFSPDLTAADIENLAADQRFMIDNGMLPADAAIDIAAELVAVVAP